MKRIISVLTVMAIMAAMLAATAVPAFADAGGVPNENACLGQFNKAGNEFGLTPPELAPRFQENNAGELNKAVKNGDHHLNSPSGERFGC